MSSSTSSFTISILVATYNRESLLAPLLASIDEAAAELKTAAVEVVVVDDGSSDETWTRLEEEKKIRPNLVIERQQNSGRAAALNATIRLATGDLGFILDSDDLLSKESLRLVEEAWLPVSQDQAYAGVMGNAVYLDGLKEGQIIGSDFPEGLTDTDPEELRVKLGIQGDKREVIRLSLMKADPFPLTPGEKRVPTSLMLNRIGEKHKFRVIRGALIRKTYLEGGMTSTIDRQRAMAPHGSRLIYKEALHRGRFPSFKYTLRNVTNLVRYNLHAKMGMMKDVKMAAPIHAVLAGIALGTGLYLRDRRKIPALRKKS